ncbi:MAG: FCD domain-containing protein [Pseudomonadota bacterium]
MTSIAVSAIEDMIVSGELLAGDRINESTLAERLGISRGPIREACRSLEQAGLLTSKTNRGMYVREVSLDEAQELYELRGAVAGLAGELIVKRASTEDIDDLKRLVDQMQDAAGEGATEKYYKLNLQFHNDLVRAARNGALEDTYRKIVNQLHLLRRRGLVQEGNLLVSNAEHRAIVTALAARDTETAALALRQHVSNGLTRLIASL